MTKGKSLKIWRKNFEIPNIDYQMPFEAMKGFYESLVRLGLKNPIKEGIWITKNGNNPGTYFPKIQLRRIAEELLNKVVNSSDWADRISKNILKKNKDYYAYSKYLDRLDLDRLSDKELLKKYHKLKRLQYHAHIDALSITWLLDSDGEDYSNYLLNYLDKKIKEKKSNKNAAEIFSVLTTPTRDTLARIEEKEALNILKIIIKDKKALKSFRKDLDTIEKDFDDLPKKIRTKIIAHYKKWRWTPYTYIGPVYNLNFYLEMFANLVKEKINSDKLLQKYKGIHQQTKKKQTKLLRELKISGHYQHLFKIAQDIVFLKGYRKDCLFLGFYVMDQILSIFAKKQGLSLMQIKFATVDEIDDIVFGKGVMADELNERRKFSVLYMNLGNAQILLGKKAKKLLAKQNFEKIKIKKIKQVQGTCACPGKARGIVSIVNVPEDMKKMKKGDIMLAHATYPALVPAMKKASAIVTEEGGITCHAAIVSREMKTPCIVGVKMLLNVFKDGDEVEVSAALGTIKKS